MHFVKSYTQFDLIPSLILNMKIKKSCEDFMSYTGIFDYVIFYLDPVEPNPPAPRWVSVNSSQTQNSAFKNGAITNCAILSP